MSGRERNEQDSRGEGGSALGASGGMAGSPEVYVPSPTEMLLNARTTGTSSEPAWREAVQMRKPTRGKSRILCKPARGQERQVGRPSDARMSMSKTVHRPERPRADDDSDSQSVQTTPLAAASQEEGVSQALSQHFDEAVGADQAGPSGGEGGSWAGASANSQRPDGNLPANLNEDAAQREARAASNLGEAAAPEARATSNLDGQGAQREVRASSSLDEDADQREARAASNLEEVAAQRGVRATSNLNEEAAQRGARAGSTRGSEVAVQQLVEMGFMDGPELRSALAASKGEVQGAIERLVKKIEAPPSESAGAGAQRKRAHATQGQVFPARTGAEKSTGDLAAMDRDGDSDASVEHAAPRKRGRFLGSDSEEADSTERVQAGPSVAPAAGNVRRIPHANAPVVWDSDSSSEDSMRPEADPVPSNRPAAAPERLASERPAHASSSARPAQGQSSIPSQSSAARQAASAAAAADASRIPAEQGNVSESDEDVERVRGEHQKFNKLIAKVQSNKSADKIDARGFIFGTVPTRLWKELFQAIQKNTSHTQLDLRECQLGDRGVELLSKYLLAPGCNLTWLDLAWNGIKRKGALSLKEGLFASQRLAYLDLRWNHISKRGENWVHKIQNRLKKHQGRTLVVEMDNNEPPRVGRSRHAVAAFSENEASSAGTDMEESEEEDAQREDSDDSEDGLSRAYAELKRMNQRQTGRADSGSDSDGRAEDKYGYAASSEAFGDAFSEMDFGGGGGGQERVGSGQRRPAAGQPNSRAAARGPSLGPQKLNADKQQELDRQEQLEERYTELWDTARRERNVHREGPRDAAEVGAGAGHEHVRRAEGQNLKRPAAAGGGGGKGGGGARGGGGRGGGGGGMANQFPAGPSRVGMGTLQRPPHARNAPQPRRTAAHAQGGAGAEEDYGYEEPEPMMDEDVPCSSAPPPDFGVRPEQERQNAFKFDPVKQHPYPRCVAVPVWEDEALLSMRRDVPAEAVEVFDIQDLRGGFTTLENTLDSLKSGQAGVWSLAQCEHFFDFVGREIVRCETDPHISPQIRGQVNKAVLRGMDSILRYNGFLTSARALTQHGWCKLYCRLSARYLTWLKHFDEWDQTAQLQPGEAAYYRFSQHCDRLMKTLLALLDRGEVARDMMHVLRERPEAPLAGKQSARCFVYLWVKLIQCFDASADSGAPGGPGIPAGCSHYWQLLAKNLEDVTYRFSFLPCMRNLEDDPTFTGGDPPRTCSREEAAELAWSALWMSTILFCQHGMAMEKAPWDIVSQLLESGPLAVESEVFRCDQLFGVFPVGQEPRAAFKKQLLVRLALLQSRWPSVPPAGKPYCLDLALVKEFRGGPRKKNLISELLMGVLKGAQRELGMSAWCSAGQDEIRTIGQEGASRFNQNSVQSSLCVMVLRFFEDMACQLREQHPGSEELHRELAGAPKKILSQKFLGAISSNPIKFKFGAQPVGSVTSGPQQHRAAAARDRSTLRARFRTVICILTFMAGRDADWKIFWTEIEKLVEIPSQIDLSSERLWTSEEIDFDYSMRTAFVAAAENLAGRLLAQSLSAATILSKLQLAWGHAVKEFRAMTPELATAGSAPVFGRNARAGGQAGQLAAEEAERKLEECSMRKKRGREFLAATLDVLERMVRARQKAVIQSGHLTNEPALLGLEALLCAETALLIVPDELVWLKDKSISWRIIVLLGDIADIIIRIDTVRLKNLAREPRAKAGPVHPVESDDEFDGIEPAEEEVSTLAAACKLIHVLEAVKNCIRMAGFEQLSAKMQDKLLSVFAQIRINLIRHGGASAERCEVLEKKVLTEEVSEKNLLLLSAMLETLLTPSDFESHEKNLFRDKVMSIWFASMLEAKALVRRDNTAMCLQLRLTCALGEGELGHCFVPVMRGVYRDAWNMDSQLDADAKEAWGADAEVYQARLNCLSALARRLAADNSVAGEVFSQIQRVVEIQKARSEAKEKAPYMLYVLRLFGVLYPACARKLYSLSTFVNGGQQSNAALELCNYVFKEEHVTDGNGEYSPQQLQYLQRERKRAVLAALRGIAQLRLDNKLVEAAMRTLRIALAADGGLEGHAYEQHVGALISTIAEQPQGPAPPESACRFPIKLSPGMPGLRQVATMELVKSLSREKESRSAGQLLQKLAVAGFAGGDAVARVHFAVSQLTWLCELAAITGDRSKSERAVSSVMALVRALFLPDDLGRNQLFAQRDGQDGTVGAAVKAFLELQTCAVCLLVCRLLAGATRPYNSPAWSEVVKSRDAAALALSQRLKAAELPVAMDGGFDIVGFAASEDPLPSKLLEQAVWYLVRLLDVSEELLAFGRQFKPALKDAMQISPIPHLFDGESDLSVGTEKLLDHLAEVSG